MANVEDELECRVCRGGSDLPLRPLFSPCLCSGSIGLVHQDCLEAWLEHSRKESCELCKQKYSFDPEYSKETPDVIPFKILLYSGFKKLFVDVLPFMIRILLAILLWLVFAPLCTSWMYKIWFRSIFLFSEVNYYNDYSALGNMLFKDSTTGLVLMGVIAISFIVLVRFYQNTCDCSTVGYCTDVILHLYL